MDKTRFSLVAIRAEAPAEQRVLARLPRMPGLPSVTCSFCSSRPAFKFSFFSVSFGQGRFITRHESILTFVLQFFVYTFILTGWKMNWKYVWENRLILNIRF